jgi:hypothetical protein
MKRKRDSQDDDIQDSKSQKIYTNNQSPFDLKSLREIRRDGDLIILNIKDKKFFYNIDGLYDYVFKFYNFSDPFTRENLTYEHLDFIRYKAYKRGLIKGLITFNNKIIKTPKSSYSHDLSKFFYIERIVENMKENNKLYTEIKSTFEKYFLSNEKLDYFNGHYIGFPLIVCDNYKYKPLTNGDLVNMRNLNIFDCNFLDPITFKPIHDFKREELIKLKVDVKQSIPNHDPLTLGTDVVVKMWLIFSTNDLFISIFDNMNCNTFTIEQLDYICYEYNKLLNIKNDWVFNSPYNSPEWMRYSYKEYGKYYKYNYISRINRFLVFLDYKDNIYVEHINSYIHKFWRKFYENKKGVFERLIYIPWNINTT